MSVTMERELLVGLGVSSSAAPGADPVAEAALAETLGFDFVSVSDHPVGTEPSYETATLLTWIAARTHRIQIASRVLGVPFRRPALLAKSAESLHRLSGGRLILGLGGGYSDAEIEAVGGPVPSPRQKVDGMADAITILHRAWREPAVTYRGAVHSVADLRLEPKPETPIPIWLGTYGPRALGVTGAQADGWIPSLGFAAPAQVPAMLDRIRHASVAAGRSADAVCAVYNVPVRLAPAARSSSDEVSGPPAHVVERLGEFLDLGFTGFNLQVSPDDVRAVAAEVLPELRDIGARSAT